MTVGTSVDSLFESVKPLVEQFAQRKAVYVVNRLRVYEHNYYLKNREKVIARAKKSWKVKKRRMKLWQIKQMKKKGKE